MLNRKCPSCSKGIDYACVSHFNRANRLNSKCISCCHTYLTKEQKAERSSSRHRANRHLTSRYGVTIDQKQKMYDDQDGKCANLGCRRLFKNLGDAHLDHSHATNRLRSLLCKQCNMALGLLKDSTEAIRGLARYIETYTPLDSTVRITEDGRGKWARKHVLDKSQT
jgi:hypothetical protein